MNIKDVVFKLVGSRGLKTTGMYAGMAELAGVAKKGENFGQILPQKTVLDELAKKRMVFFGETHAVPQVIAMQCAIQERLIEESAEEKADSKLPLNVVFEHFSYEMQDILEGYQAGTISFDDMLAKYAAIGTENHDIQAYRSLLEHAKENKDKIKLHAGFIPRTYARIVMREGEEAAIKAVEGKNYLPADCTTFEGSEMHYNMFESMISKRSMYDEDLKPGDQFRKLFKAQLIKDVAMAHKVNTLLGASTNSEKYFVISGKGHCMHYQGVPDMIFKANPELREDSALVVAHESDPTVDTYEEEEAAFIKGVEETFGPPGANPADYLYIYEVEEEEEDEGEEEAKAGEQVKAETAAAYNKVGETAHLKGNLKKAKAIMSYLGYTDEEFKIAGQDAYNYQGVGNPHHFAKIQAGEKVLDVGSGLGVDSFIACNYAGASGKVIGLDISKQEVKHAEGRAKERGLDMRFVVADMENIPLPDNLFDVVISNGAFCLAPSKEKAFREIFRVLRPGGRMAICTSTVKMQLEAGVNWPICMRMFVHQDELVPLCTKIGFEGTVVDDTNSLMQYDLPTEDGAKEPSGENGQTLTEQEQKDQASRNKVHVGSEEFKHLKDYDMNKICARVCVIAKKPEEKA